MKLKSRYQLLALLNSESLSKTFLAIDEGLELPQKCVIKQFKVSCESLADLKLSEAEKLIIQGINKSDFFAKIIDVFLENGKLYLVREFIEGINLKEVLEKESVFNESQIWRLLNDLLPVLGWLHESKLIHQQIKPTNIIRTSDRHYKLLDLDLTQLLPQTFKQLGLKTIASAEYSASEQLRGETVFASDLYSLGVTCIYLLTGVHPFELFDSVNNCWIWQEYLPNKISGDLERAINKLIHNDFNLRFSSATEVLKSINSDPLVYLVNKISDKSEVQKWQCIQTLQLTKSVLGSINSIALNNQENIIAAARDDKNVELWDLKSKSQKATLSGHKSIIRVIDFSKDGKFIASGGDDKTVKIWDVETEREIITLTGHNNSIRAILYSSCGNLLTTGSWDKTIKIWKVDTFQQICTIPAHKLQINSIDFSPDGKLLASGSCDRTITLWDISTLSSPKLISTLTGHLWAVLTVAFHPNQPIIASGSDDNTIKLWNYQSGELIYTISAHSRSVSSLRFTPDGKYIVSASWDNTIKLWQLDSGAEIVTLLGHSNAVNSIMVSQDGQKIISCSKDQTIKIWECLNQNRA